MIVSDPERVTELFHKHDIAFSECEVLVIELPGGASDLTKVLSALLMAEVNIIFSYPLLVRPRGRAVLVMHVDDSECSSSVLRGGGFKILAQRISLVSALQPANQRGIPEDLLLDIPLARVQVLRKWRTADLWISLPVAGNANSASFLPDETAFSSVGFLCLSGVTGLDAQSQKLATAILRF